MRGKEGIIGTVIGVLLGVGASLAGLSSDAIKAGICGAQPAPVAAPAK